MSTLAEGEKQHVAMSNLPEEVLSDIFLKLPVESILSSKCVCKFWRYIISSPNFIKYHLNNGVGKLIYAKKTMCSIDYASISLSKSSNYEVVEMDYPFRYNKFDSVQICGSSNDLPFPEEAMSHPNGVVGGLGECLCLVVDGNESCSFPSNTDLWVHCETVASSDGVEVKTAH
ncbi:uncharacterized protein LOC113305221 [Papaver somniferum]|uniref:uncharacterized protein LOC113305221 n=1 Tax=Papaver somniferum TaxID=3469 RepID=UPI000E6F5811|nr:uncharacterized protein LOC113305221 [Papaver somniferum]